MPINFISSGSNSANTGYVASTYTTPSITFSAGDYFLYFNNPQAAFAIPSATATLKGITGTMVKDPNPGGSHATQYTLWQFLGVTAGTGTITVTCTGGSFGLLSLSWIGMTGVNWTGTVYTTDVAGNHADPQTVTGTVPTGAGAGAIFITGSDTGNPTTWANATDIPACAVSGSQISTAVGVTYSPGSVTVGATGGGGGNGWGFPGGKSQMVFAALHSLTGPIPDEKCFQGTALQVIMVQ